MDPLLSNVVSFARYYASQRERVLLLGGSQAAGTGPGSQARLGGFPFVTQPSISGAPTQPVQQQEPLAAPLQSFAEARERLRKALDEALALQESYTAPRETGGN